MANKKEQILKNRNRRAHRVRARLSNKEVMHPRLAVFRSNAHIYAQVIDDATGKTLASASTMLPAKEKGKAAGKGAKSAKGGSASGGKSDAAKAVGREVAERAKKAGISSVVFDRGSYRYHGRVKALAEGAREGGLKF